MNLDLKENYVNVITVEAPELLNKYIYELTKQVNGETGGFLLSEDKEIVLEKAMELIVNPWAVDPNSKRIKGKLYQFLKEEILDNMSQQYLVIRNELERFYFSLDDSVQYTIGFDENFDVPDILKMADVRIETCSISPLEKLVEYIRILSKLCCVRVVVLLNAKGIFKKKEISELYKEMAYAKIQLILFECHQTYFLENEKNVIIDKDYCIIEL